MFPLFLDLQISGTGAAAHLLLAASKRCLDRSFARVLRNCLSVGWPAGIGIELGSGELIADMNSRCMALHPVMVSASDRSRSEISLQRKSTLVVTSLRKSQILSSWPVCRDSARLIRRRVSSSPPRRCPICLRMRCSLSVCTDGNVDMQSVQNETGAILCKSRSS